MARWCGNVGFAETKEISPGVWQTRIEEHFYSGDKITESSSYQNSNQVNDDIRLNVRIEIVADPFAYKNFMHIRCVEYMGVKWKVTSVNPLSYPRISLEVGGLYEDENEG